MDDKKQLARILNHLGEDREHYQRAVSPPIMQTSIFSFSSVDEMRKGLETEFETPFYTRGYNPTVAMLGKKIAALASAEMALVFASGSAAVSAAVISAVKAGDHVICVQKPYSWTFKLLTNLLSQFGVESTFIDGTALSHYEHAIQPNTTLIYLESPNSLTFELQDIEAVAQLAKKHNITTIIDNSYATPLYQKPLEMGIDMTVHSASKYLNGHSDIVAGVLCTSKVRGDQIFASELMTLGGIISPNDAWLMIRGLRTLELRLERSANNAEIIVPFLEAHPKVEKVLFPFSPNHPQYELAKKQMDGCGGLFSILLKADDIPAVERFCNSLEFFHIACSWGGYESLQFPVCALYDSLNYNNPELPWNMVRMYLGVEDAEVLKADLLQALNNI